MSSPVPASKPKGRFHLSFGEKIGIFLAIVLAGVPWWWHYGPWANADPDPAATPPAAQPTSAATSPTTTASESSTKPASKIVGMSGGCDPFQVFAQDRWKPRGAAIRVAPNVLSEQISGYEGNMSIAVDGWVHGRPAYNSNKPPWNSDVWYHLANGTGWVSFPGVRALPTAFDPTGLKDGGPPAAVSPGCQGSVN